MTKLDRAIEMFTHMQGRNNILTKKISSLEMRSASVARILSIRMVQQMALQVLGPGECTPTTVILTSKLLALVLAMCILSLSSSSYWICVVGCNVSHSA